MMSAFVWLDYSERERRKMLDVVDLFREHDTRDEFGVGSVRDAFADMLFPGTSTIMTRARYFLLVPWAYQRLERLRIRSAEIAARARQAELNLVEPIERSDDNDGNIGKLAKTTLKRLPSSVYWQGLSVWGIRSFRGAQVQYHRSLDRYYMQITRQGGRAPPLPRQSCSLAQALRHTRPWRIRVFSCPYDKAESVLSTMTSLKSPVIMTPFSISFGGADLFVFPDNGVARTTTGRAFDLSGAFFAGDVESLIADFWSPCGAGIHVELISAASVGRRDPRVINCVLGFSAVRKHRWDRNRCQRE
jgi:hypothetical protein